MIARKIRRGVWVVVSLLVPIGVAGQQPPVGLGAGAGRAAAAPADQQWPDAYRIGPGVTVPRLLREVKPRYTAEAMRAKVQGRVLLECVVEPDGSVQRVRVSRSLDTVFGLDGEAITAAKQWRFTPGSREGAPVPVLITIELSFTLRDPPPDMVPLALPATFVDPSPPGAAANTVWQQNSVHAAPFDVQVSYPKGWVALLGLRDLPFVLQPEDASLAAAMVAPSPVSFALAEPGTPAMLQQAAEIVARGFKRQAAAFGQIRTGGRLWVWFDLGIADTDVASVQLLPPGATAAAGNHLWLFSTTVEQNQVTLAFMTLHARDSTREDWDAQAHRAGPVFATILQRLSFRLP